MMGAVEYATVEEEGVDMEVEVANEVSKGKQ